MRLGILILSRVLSTVRQEVPMNTVIIKEVKYRLLCYAIFQAITSFFIMATAPPPMAIEQRMIGLTSLHGTASWLPRRLSWQLDSVWSGLPHYYFFLYTQQHLKARPRAGGTNIRLCRRPWKQRPQTYASNTATYGVSSVLN